MAKFARPSEFRGGAFFGPKHHMTHLAMLVEPKSIERNVPNEYRGKVTHRDEVIADITIFDNQAALDNAEPTEVIKSAKVVHGMLTDFLDKIMGSAAVVTLDKTPTRNGEGYVFRDVDAETEEKVGVYYDKREAEIEAAMADVPDFEDED